MKTATKEKITIGCKPTNTEQFKPTSDQIVAANDVFICMKEVDEIKPIVKGYRKKVLAELNPINIENGETIKDIEQDYLMSDDDFKVYMKRCNDERIKAKLHVDNPEHCPLLVAEEKVRQSERILIKTMEPITKVNQHSIICSGLDNYYKIIKLTLKWLSPYCKESK